jgi:hypothetical protein
MTACGLCDERIVRARLGRCRDINLFRSGQAFPSGNLEMLPPIIKRKIFRTFSFIRLSFDSLDVGFQGAIVAMLHVFSKENKLPGATKWIVPLRWNQYSAGS